MDALTHRMMRAAARPFPFVGGRTVSALGTVSDVSVALTSLTGGVGSAPASGDLVLVGISIAGISDIDMAAKISDGWSVIGEDYSNSSYDANFILAYKQMGSTPDTTLTMYGGSGNTSRPYVTMVQCWRGVSAAQVAATFASAKSATSTLADAPAPAGSGFPPEAVHLVFAAGTAVDAGGGEAYASSPLTGFFGSASAFNTGTPFAGAVGGHGWKLYTPAGANPAAFTYSKADATTYSNIACSVVLF